MVSRNASIVYSSIWSYFRNLGSIISKDGGSSEDVKSRIAKAQGVFSQLKKKFGRIER